MTLETRALDPFLDPDAAAALHARVRDRAPYGLYVQAPIESGLGAGLTRRHDAALAWVKRQFAAGTFEAMDVQAARTNLFRGTWLERGEDRGERVPEVVDHPGLAAAAGELLKAGLVEPYMLYANLLLPGQELPVHHDTPEFVGLDKTNTPEWFLVVCGHSGLFEPHRIRVASAVVFLGGDGDLITYPEGIESAPVGVPSRANTAVVLDADELVHGVARVGGAEAAAPPVEIGMTLDWQDGAWLLLGKDGSEIQRYLPGQVRLSLQWKAWVFADAAERDRIRARPLDRGEAEERLVAELRDRGVLEGDRPDDTQLALILMEEFVPLPT